MLWILISSFFCWLIFREFRRRRVAEAGFDNPDPAPLDKPYLALLLLLAAGFAWPPVHRLAIERFLSANATKLAEFQRAKVHCNTLFDSFFDRHYLAAGHANPQTGDIVLQYPYCDSLMAYLDHPERADRNEIASLNVFTHESMHVRGEYNEALTECESVQRNYRAARLLGVPDRIARKNALDYYRDVYLFKGDIGGIQGPYFSKNCAPGAAMDEHLPDSTWPGAATPD
jgi:hypothetical protein